MKKEWGNPTLVEVGIKSTNENEGTMPIPIYTVRCICCGTVFYNGNNSSQFLIAEQECIEHEKTCQQCPIS